VATAAKPLRADAERNRRLVLDAATAAFAEHGLDVGITEIARRAGVGRGTLFRRFPTKEHLIAAVVVHRMAETAQQARALLGAPDAADALFGLLATTLGVQQFDRALFEALGDRFLANPEIRRAHAELIGVLDELLGRAQAQGTVRKDVGALDVVMMIKGVCEATRPFASSDTGIGERQLDLVRSALRTGPVTEPLRGRSPTLEDLELASRPTPPASTPA
jgi:AcrR family transcriptional regulator